MRLETGVVQCGEDWPGVFIRGDEAAYYAHSLFGLLESLPSEPADIHVQIMTSHLAGLARLLNRSNVHAEGHAVDQRVTLVTK